MLESKAPNARSRSREGVTMTRNETPKISPTVSLKSLSSASSSLSLSVITDWHARLQRRKSRVDWLPHCQHQSKRRDDERVHSKWRCDTMLDFASVLDCWFVCLCQCESHHSVHPHKPLRAHTNGAQ